MPSSPSLTLRLPAARPQLALVRALLSVWLEGNGCAGQLVDDVQLIATELVANAVEASPAESCEVCVVLSLDPKGLDLLVEDEGGGFSLMDTAAAPGINALRGRGFLIVRALTDELHVRRVGDRTQVAVRKLR
ncbi:MAG: ATP-binding protein [Acidimicrobiales bacterium]